MNSFCSWGMLGGYLWTWAPADVEIDEENRWASRGIRTQAFLTRCPKPYHLSQHISNSNHHLIHLQFRHKKVFWATFNYGRKIRRRPKNIQRENFNNSPSGFFFTLGPNYFFETASKTIFHFCFCLETLPAKKINGKKISSLEGNRHFLENLFHSLEKNEQPTTKHLEAWNFLD